MALAARVAQTEYPGEVDDLVQELAHDVHGASLSTTAVAGYAVVAGPAADRALVFAVAAGAALDAIPLPLAKAGENSTRSPALTSWLARMERGDVQAIGVAALAPDGALRIFRSVPVRSFVQASAQCEEIRVTRALGLSAGRTGSTPCTALHVVHTPHMTGAKEGLYVFGSQGGAAFVELQDGGLEVRALSRTGSKVVDESSSVGARGSMRLGSMFYSALRSIGRDSRFYGSDWENGTGLHRIVGSGVTTHATGAFVMRHGGEVERWGPDGLAWSFNVFNFAGGRDAQKHVVSAGVTSDDTIVLLVQDNSEASPGLVLICFDGRSPKDAPSNIALEVRLSDTPHSDEAVSSFMTLSGDIAYLSIAESGLLAWVSVARGVSPDGQVQGSTGVDPNAHVLAVTNAAHHLPESGVSGGVMACLTSTGVLLVSSGVPAPVSLDEVAMGAALDGADSEPDALLWRAFLQYGADQSGAVRASLQALVQSVASGSGTALPYALGHVVEATSRRIISSGYDADDAPMALLIDTELDRKHDQHLQFLRLLGDVDAFTGLRVDAPSTTEDRLWDAIPVSSREAVLTNGEKVTCARRVRGIENVHASGNGTQRFNDAASTSLIGSEPTRGTVSSMFGDDMQSEIEDEFESSPPVVTLALRAAGHHLRPSGGRVVVGASAEDDTALYRDPQEFHRFLTELQVATQAAVSPNVKPVGLGDGDDNPIDIRGAHLRRAARNALLLACEAAIAVVQGARDSRHEHESLFELGPNGVRGIGNWSCDSALVRQPLRSLIQMSLHLAGGMRHSESAPLRRAAVLVTDEMLSCARTEAHGDENIGTGNVNPTRSPQKRRRLNFDDESSAWGRERRAALNTLRGFGLKVDAFRLAERYADFGTMMTLKVKSDDFDVFFERELDQFGEDFGFYGLRWLEARGEIRLLLRGRGGGVGSAIQAVDGAQLAGGLRSDKVLRLISDYFRLERTTTSNLAWLHWISVGDMVAAAKGLVTQTKCLSVPDKSGSAVNTKVLGSIAKLALFAAADDSGGTGPAADTELSSDTSRYVNGRLYLSRVQASLDPSRDTLMPGDELVRSYVDDAPLESSKLAEHTIVALEAIQFTDVNESVAQELEDYVWRRCVERQGHFWMPMIKGTQKLSDDQLRAKLQSCALFQAAAAVSLGTKEMKDIIARGAFDETEFAQHGCKDKLVRWVEETVSLAGRA